jgi:hypothetical protein
MGRASSACGNVVRLSIGDTETPRFDGNLLAKHVTWIPQTRRGCASLAYGRVDRLGGIGDIETPRFDGNFLANHVTRIPQTRKFPKG